MAHANIHNHFNLERHLTDWQTYRARRSGALAEWQMLVGQNAAFNDRRASCGERFALD